MLLTFIIVLCVLPPVMPLVGYDCERHKINITAISLSSVQKCIDDETAAAEKQVTIQLIQEKQYSSVSGIACLVERTTMAFHCGMHHHSSLISQAWEQNIVEHLSYEKCYDIHRDHTYITAGNVRLDNLEWNVTQVRKAQELGSNWDSYCQGGSGRIFGRWFSNSVVASIYKITFRKFTVPVDITTGEMVFPSGQRLFHHQISGFDPDYGSVFWKEEELASCKERSYIVLYQGPAVIYTNLRQEDTLIVNSTDKVMAIGLKESTLVCHQAARVTEHARLFMIEEPLSGRGFFFQPSKLSAKEIDMFLYTNSKLVYLEKHISREMRALYRHFNQRACETQHQLLNQLITIAYISVEDFAWTYTKRPGVTAVLRGEAIYLMHCTEVTVDYRPSQNCYQELPVLYNGTDKFLKPRSRIIVSYGTQVDCNPLAPVLYKLGERWYRVGSEPIETRTPLELSAMPHEQWDYVDHNNLITAGIYSPTDLKEFQRQLMFPVERPAISHLVARAITSANIDLQGVNGLHLLSPQALEKLQESIFERLYGWWWTFSVHFSGLTGVIVVFMIVKALAGMILNGRLLYRTFGFSFRLFAALWGTLAKHLVLAMMDPPTNQQASVSQPDDAPPAGYAELRKQLEEDAQPVASAPVQLRGATCMQ